MIHFHEWHDHYDELADDNRTDVIVCAYDCVLVCGSVEKGWTDTFDGFVELSTCRMRLERWRQGCECVHVVTDRKEQS